MLEIGEVAVIRIRDVDDACLARIGEHEASRSLGRTEADKIAEICSVHRQQEIESFEVLRNHFPGP